MILIYSNLGRPKLEFDSSHETFYTEDSVVVKKFKITNGKFYLVPHSFI